MPSRRLVDRLDAFQRSRTWLGLPIATVYKFVDDQGNYLAAMITYYGFVSLFPLLLLFVTVLGFVLEDNPQLQGQLVDSALAQFPVIGDQIQQNVGSLRGSGLGLAVGLLGTIYGGLGIAQAVQNAFNRVWAVPRNERPDPVRARLRGLLLLLVIGAGVLATTALSALSTSTQSYDAAIGPPLRVALTALSVALNVMLLLAVFRVATARQVSTRDIAAGAILAGVAWQALQTLGTYYMTQKLTDATAVYGLFGVVLGLLGWIYLEALIVVFCAEINAVWRRRLWPRALLTPVTDDVDLTAADEKAYASYASSESFKGFEQVHVDFGREDDPGRPADEGSRSG